MTNTEIHEQEHPPADDKVDPRQIAAADIDANGNVTLWDHGPQEPKDLDHDDPRYLAAGAEGEAWHEKNGPGPVALVMHSGDARHAISVEPERYSIDPIDLEDSEVRAEADKIAQEREEAMHAAEERAEAMQRAADLKVAAARVLARRQAEAEAAPKPRPAPPKPLPGPQENTAS